MAQRLKARAVRGYSVNYQHPLGGSQLSVTTWHPHPLLPSRCQAHVVQRNIHVGHPYTYIYIYIYINFIYIYINFKKFKRKIITKFNSMETFFHNLASSQLSDTWIYNIQKCMKNNIISSTWRIKGSLLKK